MISSRPNNDTFDKIARFNPNPEDTINEQISTKETKSVKVAKRDTDRLAMNMIRTYKMMEHGTIGKEISEYYKMIRRENKYGYQAELTKEQIPKRTRLEYNTNKFRISRNDKDMLNCKSSVNRKSRSKPPLPSSTSVRRKANSKRSKMNVQYKNLLNRKFSNYRRYKNKTSSSTRLKHPKIEKTRLISDLEQDYIQALHDYKDNIKNII